MEKQLIDQVECGSFRHGSWGTTRGRRTPDPVEWEIEPVSGSLKAFILPMALVEAGLLVRMEGQSLDQTATEKWDRSIDRLFIDLAKRNITKTRIEACTNGLKRSIIGWAYDPSTKNKYPEIHLCTDLAMTLAILSRCVNHIFFSAREPNYDWDLLFSHNLVVDEFFTGLNFPTKPLSTY